MTPTPRLERFLVGVQRRPLTSILSVVAAILLLGLAFRGLGTDDSGFAWVFVSTCLAMASAEIGARATSLWARLVIVGLGSGSAWPVLAILLDHARDDLWIVGLVALMVAVPHAVASAAARLRRPTHGLVALALAIAAASLPAIAEGVRDSNRDLGVACLLAWVLALQLAFLAAARSPASITAIVTTAVALGAAGGIERAALAQTWSGALTSWKWMAVAWLAGGLLVPLARLGGSFTAVPDDHPVRADFARPGAA